MIDAFDAAAAAATTREAAAVDGGVSRVGRKRKRSERARGADQWPNNNNFFNFLIFFLKINK